MALVNTGMEGWKVLKGIFLDDQSSIHMIMPNIGMISPSAIVPDTATITFNTSADITPTGGADGDVWYNQPSDNLYTKIAGTWTLLTDRVINNYYQGPVENLTDCPLPV